MVCNMNVVCRMNTPGPKLQMQQHCVPSCTQYPANYRLRVLRWVVVHNDGFKIPSIPEVFFQGTSTGLSS